MDNLTHALISMSFAEVSLRIRQNPDEKNRGSLLFWAIVAGNLPDFDFIYTPITEGKLGYLLHHRGHTHTLLGVIPQFLVLMLIIWLYKRFKKEKFSNQDQLWMYGLCLVCMFFHVFMDFWNIYGVHPFWPFDSNWYFGDAVAIIEPWLWCTFMGAHIVAARTGRGKIILGITLAGALAIGAFFLQTIPWLLGGLVLYTAGFIFLCWKGGRAFQAWAPLAIGIVMLAGFFSLSGKVSERFESQLRSQFPGGEVLDAMVTPIPANPICWLAIGLVQDGDEYVARGGVMSLLPTPTPAWECTKFPVFATTAKRTKVEGLPLSRSWMWIGEYRKPLGEFRLEMANCFAQAFLQFSRAPFTYFLKDGRMGLGDFRFDRAGEDFSEFIVPKEGEAECPKFLPGWIPPRNDLFGVTNE